MRDASRTIKGCRALITGGLGMIGSSIAIKLVEQGAEVTLVDGCISPYGANEFNIEPIRDDVRVNMADIRDREAMKCLVRNQDVIFNLAGQVSHNDSMNDPNLDADINYIGHLNVLECVLRHNPDAVIMHAGSRLQYGQIESIPVAEDHPQRPRTPYALNKSAAENMYRFYHYMHGTRTIAFRIANPYGPRGQMAHSKYCMVNWFIRQAMDDGDIRIFGDGQQVRDYIFVDDLADAFIAAAFTDACVGEVFNVGSGSPTRFVEMVETVVDVVGSGQVQYIPWPEDYVNVETGDYVTDTGKLNGLTGWSAHIGFEEGVRQTVAYYKEHHRHYWQS